MSKETPKALLNAAPDSTIESLKDIERLHVFRNRDDTMSAIKQGAVLLGISRMDNDDNGDGFRYLIGLRRGIKLNRYLEHIISELD